MTPCCPNCGSAQSLGIEAASICTECASATVAGASFSLPLLIAGVVGAGVAVIVFKVLRRHGGGLVHLKQAALG